MAAGAGSSRPARLGHTGWREWVAAWTDDQDKRRTERFPTEDAAVIQVARRHAGGLRYYDLRHSYATWLVDDGVLPNMVSG